MSIRLSSRKRRYSQCHTSTVVFFEDKFSLLFYSGLLLIVYFFAFFHSIISRQPILEQLESVWQNINQRGWITIQATQSLESLLNTGGSLWFVTNIVKQVLKYRYQEELDQAVDLAFAVFHLDIENCTLDLINHVIPQYLQNSLQ